MAEERGRVAALNQRTIKALGPEAGRYIVWDKDLKGFGLRVEPSGARTFIVRYRVGGGRTGTRRQFKIGTYGKLTPETARDAASRVLAEVELGKDPQGVRAQERQAQTIAQLCDLYLAEGCSTKKAGTVSLDRIRIEGHIKPLIGRRKITQASRADIERLRDAVAAGRFKAAEPDETGALAENPKRGARVRGGRTASTKTVKLLRAIFNFAIGRKLCESNPCIGVETFADNRRERFLSPAELGRLGDALTAAEAEGANLHHATIVRLLSLTGARKNEIARLRWSEVDAARGLLQLEDSKTGRKAIRLGAAALEVLNEIPRTKSAFVFPDPRDPSLPIRNLDWFWVGVRKRACLDDVRIHDLRHSFASVGVAGGAGLYLVGKLLGHSHVATTQRYAHLADDPMRAAADSIARQHRGDNFGPAWWSSESAGD